MKIQILLFDGFDELDVIAPFEVLSMAAMLDGADLRVEFASVGERRRVTGQYGLSLDSDAALDEQAPPDVLIVPGGGWAVKAERGAWAEYHREEVPRAIARIHAAGAAVAAVCTGTMLLARAGLLAGHAAVTHHQALEDLRAAGVETVTARVVDDGRIVTSGGVTSGLDLALWIVERYFGPRAAYGVERRLEYERRGTVWRRH